MNMFKNIIQTLAAPVAFFSTAPVIRFNTLSDVLDNLHCAHPSEFHDAADELLDFLEAKQHQVTRVMVGREEHIKFDADRRLVLVRQVSTDIHTLYFIRGERWMRVGRAKCDCSFEHGRVHFVPKTNH